MSKSIFQHTYDNIISLENLLEAWKEFASGKRARKDVQEFERNLMANIISLHRELATKNYSHSAYQAFKISDPKPRDIHKASVRDRLLHHALHRSLSPFFIKTFISDSYSCQIGKGTHRALKRFKRFSKIVSRNDTRTAWVLKCDIKKFFANIDHKVLIGIMDLYIPDKDITRLLSVIIGSFRSNAEGIGLPLGNLTSQLFVNIYMNEFDQFVKHVLKVRNYIRYADDFVIMHHDKKVLMIFLLKAQNFLNNRLKLSLHPDKIFLKTATSGIDFLGWVHFPTHRVMRTATKKRMFRQIQMRYSIQIMISYQGLFKHGNTHKVSNRLHEIVESLSERSSIAL